MSGRSAPLPMERSAGYQEHIVRVLALWVELFAVVLVTPDVPDVGANRLFSA